MLVSFNEHVVEVKESATVRMRSALQLDVPSLFSGFSIELRHEYWTKFKGKAGVEIFSHSLQQSSTSQ